MPIFAKRIRAEQSWRTGPAGHHNVSFKLRSDLAGASLRFGDREKIWNRVPIVFIRNSSALHNQAGDCARMKWIRRTIGLAMIIVALCLVGYPLFDSGYFLAFDRGLRSAEPSTFAFSLHRSISQRIPGYVDERIGSGVAKSLSGSQVTATESPVYGAFFYLLATANL
jgi:hypothetical protein